jgi:hypothetical protein
MYMSDVLEFRKDNGVQWRAQYGSAVASAVPGLRPRIVPVLRPMPQPGLPRGAYRSPKNLRTRADLRARTRKTGSENTTWEMLPYRS